MALLHILVGSSMSSHNLFRMLLSLLFISTLLHAAAAAAASASKSTTNANQMFIKKQCDSTTYPKVCYKSLSPYASKINTNSLTLTKMSVNVALKAAKSASKTLTKLSNSKGSLTHAETSVIADCQENIDDTVDILKESAKGLLHLSGTTTSDEKFQWDTIKTWMSAAITDEVTCTDELDELKVRPSLQNKIKTSVSNVASLTSNALAFVNRLTY
ncbi:pectinesterase inhibitor 7-like [Gastrolobium bilobum]|uniref:pectinesterase inhibitor 7-like n=1 Tax=Gastrolobium bilobum TaxID=150636 RepID=UPI002AB1DA96|nr:pectinesterase inhibitor 7-like [Gastrolobium bilobum]